MQLSFNYFAMVVGYIAIFLVSLFILMLVAFYLKDKHDEWKWNKDRERRVEQKKEEEKKKEVEKPDAETASGQEKA